MLSTFSVGLLAGSLLLLSSTAHAQVPFKIGPQLGLNAATVHFSRSTPTTVRSRPGVEAGVVGALTLGHVVLQPAVHYAQQGYRQHSEIIEEPSSPAGGSLIYDTEVRLNYLTVPLTVAYTQRRTGEGFQVFAGPYMGVLLNGHYQDKLDGHTVRGKVRAGEHPADQPATSTTAYSKRLGGGLQAGVGYCYAGLLLQVGYRQGLRNLATEYAISSIPTQGRRYENRAFYLSLAYLIGPAS